MARSPLFSSLPGFSLIETCFVLMILGIITSIGVKSFRFALQLQQERLTIQRQENLTKAIAAFVAQHGILPCPTPLEKNFPLGEEAPRRDERSCLSFQGIVPYKILGLSEEEAKDGYQRFFRYIIQPLAFKRAEDLHFSKQEFSRLEKFCLEQSAFPSTEKVLRVYDAEKRALLKDSSPIAFILISHGKRGLGAPLSNLAPPVGSAEEENSNGDQVIIAQAPFPFDHHVKWITYANLMALYVGFPCRARENRNDSVSEQKKDTSLPLLIP